MSEKYFSEIEGYESCFVEVSDNWTLKEVREFTDNDEDVYFDYFVKKVESMFLRDVNGVEYTNPRDFVPENLDNFDIALVGFVGGILPLHIRRRKSLGNLNVRPSSLSSESKTKQKKN